MELIEPSQLSTDSADIQADTLSHVNWATAQEQDPEIARIYHAKLNASTDPNGQTLNVCQRLLRTCGVNVIDYRW
jgi:hypothetical protein